MARTSLGLLEAGAGPLGGGLRAAAETVEETVTVLGGEHNVVVEQVRGGERDPRRHAVVVHAQLRLRPEQAEVPQGVAGERVRDAHEWNEERALRDEQLRGVRLVPLDEVEEALEPGRARTLAVLAAAAASGHRNAEAAKAERCEEAGCEKEEASVKNRESKMIFQPINGHMGSDWTNVRKRFRLVFGPKTSNL